MMPNQNAVDPTALKRVVLAGEKVLYDPKMRESTIRGLQAKAAPDDVLATNVVGLMRLLMDKASGKIPPAIIAPASVALCIELSSFAKEAGLMNIDMKTLQSALQKTVLGVAKAFGVLDALQQGGQQTTPPGQASVGG